MLSVVTAIDEDERFLAASVDADAKARHFIVPNQIRSRSGFRDFLVHIGRTRICVRNFIAWFGRHQSYPPLRGRSGNFATLAAMRRASSLSSSFAAEHQARLIFEIDIRELLAVVVAHDKAGGLFFDSPGRREAACRHG